MKKFPSAIHHLSVLLFFLLFTIGCQSKGSTTASIRQQNPAEQPIPFDTLEVVQVILNDSFPAFKLDRLVKGDINFDSIEDLLVVMNKKVSADSTSESGQIDGRKVVLLVNNGASGYAVGSMNDSIAECSSCGSENIPDPLQEISIKENDIIFKTNFGTKGSQVTTVRYDADFNDWMLYEQIRTDFLDFGKVSRRKQKVIIELTKEKVGNIPFKKVSKGYILERSKIYYIPKLDSIGLVEVKKETLDSLRKIKE